jgi:hypothetical protein
MDIKNLRSHPKYDEIMRVYKRFHDQINPYSELRAAEIIRIGERLEEFSEDKLYEAIRHFKSNSWWMQKHSFRCAGWFFKSKDQIKKFMKIKSDKEYDLDYYHRTGYQIVR